MIILRRCGVKINTKNKKPIAICSRFFNYFLNQNDLVRKVAARLFDRDAQPGERVEPDVTGMRFPVTAGTATSNRRHPGSSPVQMPWTATDRFRFRRPGRCPDQPSRKTACRRNRHCAGRARWPGWTNDQSVPATHLQRGVGWACNCRWGWPARFRPRWTPCWRPSPTARCRSGWRPRRG